MPIFFALAFVGCGVFVGDDTVSVVGVDSDCGGPIEESLDADFASALDPSGCQYRVTAVGESHRLLLDVPLFAEALTDGGGTATYTLPDDTVRLTVELGCDLDAGWCGVDGSASILDTYTPTAGTLTVSVTPDDASGGEDALATITFEAVTLESTTGDEVTIDALTWTDVRLYGVEP